MCLKKMDLWKVLIDLYFLSQHLGIRNIVLLFFLYLFVQVIVYGWAPSFTIIWDDIFRTFSKHLMQIQVFG